MDYEKKYPITQLPGKVLVGRWTRGYKEVELSYENRVLFEFNGGVSKLKKGVSFLDAQLGKVELKLSDKPVMMDIIIDGFHSRSNISHPERELKKTANYFWIIFTFSLVSITLNGFSFGIEGIIGMIFSAAYLVSAILVGQGIPWGFYLGFSFFGLSYLFGLLALPLGFGFIALIAFAIRTTFLVFLITSMKYAAGAIRHNRYLRPHNEELIDI